MIITLSNVFEILIDNNYNSWFIVTSSSKYDNRGCLHVVNVTTPYTKNETLYSA